VNFIVSEPNLFSLGMENAYSTLNSANTTDQELDDAVDQCVSGLFSVFATMNQLPIIRAAKDGPAALIVVRVILQIS
jgi:hypothetical protein